MLEILFYAWLLPTLALTSSLLLYLLVFVEVDENEDARAKAKEGIEDWLGFIEEPYSRAAEQVDPNERA